MTRTHHGGPNGLPRQFLASAATCNACDHRGLLPVEQMIRKLGELALVEFIINGLRGTKCGNLGATPTMLRLCEPGCPGNEDNQQ